jgi:hypothetical protein
MTSKAVSTLLTTVWRLPSASRRTIWLSGGTRACTHHCWWESSVQSTQSPTAKALPASSRSRVRRAAQRALCCCWPSWTSTVSRCTAVLLIQRWVAAVSNPGPGRSVVARVCAIWGLKPSGRSVSNENSIMMGNVFVWPGASGAPMRLPLGREDQKKWKRKDRLAGQQRQSKHEAPINRAEQLTPGNQGFKGNRARTKWRRCRGTQLSGSQHEGSGCAINHGGTPSMWVETVCESLARSQKR